MPMFMPTMITMQSYYISQVGHWPNQPKDNNFSIYLPCYCHIYTSNKYTPQMPHIQLMGEVYQDMLLSVTLPDIQYTNDDDSDNGNIDQLHGLYLVKSAKTKMASNFII